MSFPRWGFTPVMDCGHQLWGEPNLRVDDTSPKVCVRGCACLMDWTPVTPGGGWWACAERAREAPPPEQDPGLGGAGQLSCSPEATGSDLSPRTWDSGKARPGDLGESVNHLQPQVPCLPKGLIPQCTLLTPGCQGHCRFRGSKTKGSLPLPFQAQGPLSRSCPSPALSPVKNP